jgi:predicted nucleic acid-binding protein
MATQTLRVLDSSCWLEFFADTPHADAYADAIDGVQNLIVPVLTVYEVVKKLARDANDDIAAAALALMQRGQVVGIDLPLAMQAAVNGLPMADSLIYATAQAHGAELWTHDAHFAGLPGVRYLVKSA